MKFFPNLFAVIDLRPAQASELSRALSVTELIASHPRVLRGHRSMVDMEAEKELFSRKIPLIIENAIDYFPY